MHIECSAQTAGSVVVSFGANASAVEGSIRGPFSKYARTLPSTTAIRLGRCKIVDPCYWTPSTPFLYEVTVSGDTGSECKTQFMWGIRRCLPHRNDLILNGKRFVFRAIKPASMDIDLTELRELSSGLVLSHTDEKLCELASESGVMIFFDGEWVGETPPSQFGGRSLRKFRYSPLGRCIDGIIRTGSSSSSRTIGSITCQ